MVNFTSQAHLNGVITSKQVCRHCHEVPKHFQQLNAGDFDHVWTREAGGRFGRRVVAGHGQAAATLSLTRPHPPPHSPATLHARVLSTRCFSFLPFAFFRSGLHGTGAYRLKTDGACCKSGQGGTQTLGRKRTESWKQARATAPYVSRTSLRPHGADIISFPGKMHMRRRHKITRLERRQRSPS